MKLFKFETESCVLCRRMDKFLETLGIEYSKVDVTYDQVMQDKFNIQTVPTLIKFDDEGNELERYCGFSSPMEVKKFLNV